MQDACMLYNIYHLRKDNANALEKDGATGLASTRTPLPLCTSSWKHHQMMYFMTLLASYQNIALTGNQNYLRTQGSGMTFFMQLATSV